MRILLQNGQIMTRGNRLINADIWIDEGKIKAIGQGLATNQVFDQVIDIKSQLITAGLVDLHVHFREPGFTYKETIKTGSLAAARGGFTTVCAMPNLSPVPDTVKNFQKLRELIDKESVIKIQQYAPITINLKSDELVDMAALSSLGAPAFTNDGVGVQTAGTMYLAMSEAVKHHRPIVAHTEDESLLFGGCMHQGIRSEQLGLPGIMSATESSQIARDLLLAEETGASYHVCHVSTKESVRIIREAKLAGVNVTCEVCPHHLILTDCDITEDHGQFKMNPPLRSEEDRQALIEGLLDGTIDCIATDHAPHGYDEKNQTMTKAPFGIVGSETAFSLVYTEFVKKNIFTLEQVIDWLTIKPATILNLPAGRLEIGQPADLAVFNLSDTYPILAEDFLSKGNNTPFLNKEVQGQTVMTFVDGQIVWAKGEIL